MHPSTTPSLSQTIWARWASRQFFSLPIVQTLLPVTFGYSLNSEAVVMRQLWGDERGCDECHWHADTRGLPCGLPEVVRIVQVHCSRRRLLRRGLEFHGCTINKSAHMKKVWKLIIWTSCIYIYIYIYIYNLGLDLENTPIASLQRVTPPPTSILDMIWNHLMVMLQF